ncbi:ABC transporter ATP-binding protein [Chitinibacter bivalviorum]|uniref:ABC transporter ATP-binding protein n=1 Tax=Chitinibacter bivalviorum TaxID=2739434 RepID=A0A7H9BI09_9NEIS|nr:ABC transporter ATP-binding protein [Chitinibacter bivalviorum]QLG87581.1 ABC transporter ATP-binding protein [Chitinibacter bivalviorum]
MKNSLSFHLANVNVSRQGRALLDIAQLQLPAAGLTVILGHNGSGKSTLLKLLSGQMAPDRGEVLLQGKSVTHYIPRELAKRVAYMPQQIPQPALLLVRELVELGRFAWRGWLARWQSDDQSWVSRALQQAGVAHLAGHAVDEISGGERQRVWLAMLLAQNAPLLLLDEPSSALDLAHQYQLMQLLRQQADLPDCGVIAVLHDLNLALQYADRIVALQRGRIWFDGSPSQLLAHPELAALYGIELEVLHRAGKPAVVAVV